MLLSSRYVYLSIELTTTCINKILNGNQATETETQKWDYYQGLYFSYTSLLTIGYGDIYPVSNAGKPFFVFWSLLAIPSLTILISNMGDTIVKGIRDFTLWIGTLTVLPSEHGIRASTKLTVQRVCFQDLHSASLRIHHISAVTGTDYPPSR